jgi:hypothetical protein
MTDTTAFGSAEADTGADTAAMINAPASQARIVRGSRAL